MNSNQLMAAIVMANSTSLMQVKSGLRYVSDPERIEIDLSEKVFINRIVYEKAWGYGDSLCCSIRSGGCCWAHGGNHQVNNYKSGSADGI